MGLHINNINKLPDENVRVHESRQQHMSVGELSCKPTEELAVLYRKAQSPVK